MKKAAQAFSIIGGADGPTSVFLVGGKPKGFRQKIQFLFRNWSRRRKRKKAMAQVRPGAHSLQETVQYFTNKYGADEKDSTYSLYEERRQSMKYALIQREQPELIGADQIINRPDNLSLQDKDAVAQWFQKLEAWSNRCMDRMKQLPEAAFPTEYHLYVIDCSENSKIEIETDEIRGIMAIGGSGNMKKIKPIMADIYLFYGVTQKDIDEGTERYQTLLTELMM